MKKNLFSFYIILTVIALTIIFLFPARGKTECDFGVACTGDPNTIMQREGTAVENAVAGQATLISPWGQTFTTTPTYTWTAVADATWYQIWVNTSTGTLGHKWYTAEEVGCPSGTGNCSLTAPAALAPGTYTWWIQAWYDAYGPWSEGRPFYVDPNGKNCQNIAAMTFAPWGSDTLYSTLNGWKYRTGGGFYLFIAPANLPAGAQVTTIYLDYYDDVTEDVYLWFFLNFPGGFSNFIQYYTNSSGTPGFGRLELNLMPYNIIVDNAAYTYTVGVGLNYFGSPNNSFLDAIVCHKPSP